MTTGNMKRMDPADSNPQSIPINVCIFDNPTGAVTATRVVNDTARRNSFMDWIRQKMVVVARPALASGRLTFRKTWGGE